MGAPIFAAGINMIRTQITNWVNHLLATAPASPVEGQVYHNTTDHHPYYHNGTAFKDLTDAETLGTHAASYFEAVANKGVANGYASLDSGAKVPAAQLPSYVDDVLEYANLAALPGTGETGKLYITIDTGFEYRWSGSIYVRIVSSPGTTDALTEGSTNLYFLASRVLATVLTGLSTASATVVTSAHTILQAIGFLQKQITDLTATVSGKQDALGYTAENAANKDTDGTLAANSDTKYASQKATKTYVDGRIAAGPQRYSGTVGDGVATSFTIAAATHGCAADRSNMIQVVEESTGDKVVPDIVLGATGTITIGFAVAPTANQYRVNIQG